MKTTVFITALLLICVVFNKALAQEDIEKIRAKKIAFITQTIELTVEEAQIFWPVYNEYEQKLETLKIERRETMRELVKGHNTLSDEEITVLSDQFIDFDVKEAKLKREYHEKYKSVLHIKKVIKLYKAENQFKKQVLREIQKRRHNKGRR